MNRSHLGDTIFAVSTGFSVAAISVIRISGPNSAAAVLALTGWNGRDRLSVQWILDPDTGDAIDHGVVLWFAGPSSATGEDIAELQVHGSTAVRTRLLACLARLPGLRAAEPGEFTRRAIVNQRLDLSQAEGLADLLSAETAEQHRRALEQLGGGVARLVDGWRGRLVDALALLETEIDFADEELPEQRDAAGHILDELVRDLDRHLQGAAHAERLRDGFEVAIVGVPNAGKSTLLNALARRDVALTSPEAGTTRDILEVRMDLQGIAVIFLDMAGIRATATGIEAAGIKRARDRATAADLRVFLLSDPADVAELGVPPMEGDILVTGKADLLEKASGLAVSGLTGAGLSDLLDQVYLRLRDRVTASGAIAGARQRAAVAAAMEAMSMARQILEEGDAEVVAEELRVALTHLDRLTGRTEAESVLDAVFSRFCIGK